MQGLEFRGTIVKADAIEAIEGDENGVSMARHARSGTGRARSAIGKRKSQKKALHKRKKVFDEDEEPGIHNTEF
jgi:hypothetical protein